MKKSKYMNDDDFNQLPESVIEGGEILQVEKKPSRSFRYPVDPVTGKVKRTATIFDPVEYLKTDEDIVAYLQVALEEKDSEFLKAALYSIARARKISL